MAGTCVIPHPGEPQTLFPLPVPTGNENSTTRRGPARPETSSMWNIFVLLSPVFILLFLGMLAERFQLVPPFGQTTLNQFLVNLALPSLIFLSIAQCRAEDLHHGSFLAAFSLSLFLTFGLLIPAFRRLHPQGSYKEDVMLSMLASFPNVVLVGLPVLMALYPGNPSAVLASTLTNILEIPMVLVTLFMLVSSGARGRHPVRTVAVALITNPVVLASAGGALFYLTGTAVPAVLESACRALGASVMPCALVSLGIVISARLRHHDGETFHRGRQAILFSGKLLIQPVIALAAMTALGVEEPWRSMGVLLAAMPTGTLAYAMSDSYKVAENDASFAVISSTLLSLPLLLLLAMFLQ